MEYLRIIVASLFTFFVSFQTHAQEDPPNIFGNDLGSGFASGTCEENKKALLAFGGAAAEFAAECAQKVGSNIISGIGGGIRSTASTGLAIGKCIWSPLDCATEIKETASNFIDLMSQAVDKVASTFANIDPKQVAMIACEMITSAAARNLLRGGIPGILAGLVTNLSKFAALGPAALALQRLGVAIDTIINIDRVVWEQVKKLSGPAQALFAREIKMCPI